MSAKPILIEIDPVVQAFLLTDGWTRWN